MIGSITLTRAVLIDSLIEKAQLSREEASAFLEAVLEGIKEGLQEDTSVKISGFGSFRIRKKERRIGRNPKTKEEVLIPPRSVVLFTASPLLKKKLKRELLLQ